MRKERDLMRNAERLVAARQAYDHTLEVLGLAGAVLGKVENEYARVFQRYRDAGGTGCYGTSDGICKDAWEEMEAAKKAWQEAGTQRDEAWRRYVEARQAVGIEQALTRVEESKVIDRIFTEWEELERKAA